jgi:hypothetical protein
MEHYLQKKMEDDNKKQQNYGRQPQALFKQAGTCISCEVTKDF